MEEPCHITDAMGKTTAWSVHTAPISLELCIGLSAEQGTGRQDSGQAYWTPEKYRRLGPRPAPQVIKLGTTWQQFGDILAGSTSGRFLPRESNCLQGKPITNQTWAGRANARFQRAERLSRWGDKGETQPRPEVLQHHVCSSCRSPM